MLRGRRGSTLPSPRISKDFEASSHNGDENSSSADILVTFAPPIPATSSNTKTKTAAILSFGILWWACSRINHVDAGYSRHRAIPPYTTSAATHVAPPI